MNWSYVAGLFDGEGTVGIGVGKGTIAAAIAQSGSKGLSLLEEVATFVRGHGIRCVVYSTGLAGQGRRKLESYRLSIHGFSQAPLFLKEILPLLRIKRSIAQDVIRYTTLFPSIVTSPMARQYRTEKQAKSLKSGAEWLERFGGCKMGRPKGSKNKFPRRVKCLQIA